MSFDHHTQLAFFLCVGFGLGLATATRPERHVDAPTQASAVCMCPSAAPVLAVSEDLVDDTPPFPQSSREEILATKRPR